MANDDPHGQLLVMTLALHLVAVHAQTGAMAWRLQLPAAARRVFRMGARLMVVTHAQVLCVDLATGRQLGAVDLPFQPLNGLAREGQLVVSGTDGAACLDGDGRVLWAVSSVHDALRSMDFTVACRDAQGRDLWRLDLGATRTPPALLLGDEVAQPDLR